MKFIVYLMTMLFVGSAIAQNPTILQGSYISNVFGNSNFVLNPNAQTNIANVTTVTATVTRSTTTPLVATSEFTVAIGTANGTATWATRAFDAGMKNNNCEARFSYRGFAATSKVHIKQGANTVATLNLTPATDPRIASINFPCGDLSTATTFQVTDTAILAGTNEIGGIYVGLATNMANVAQAETVVLASRTSTQTITTGSYQTVVFNTVAKDQLGEYNSSTGVFTAKRAGTYQINAQVVWASATWLATNNVYLAITKNNDSNTAKIFKSTPAQTATLDQINSAGFDLVVGDTIAVQVYNDSTASKDITGVSGQGITRVQISRFPSSSELVVTPERQNTWAGVVYDDSYQLLLNSTPANAASFFSYNNVTWNKPTKLKGKASVTTTNSGNDLGFSVDQLPVGNYKVTLTNGIYPSSGLTDGNEVSCIFRIRETTTGTVIAQTVLYDARYSTWRQSRDGFGVLDGVFSQTSIARRNFILEVAKQFDSNASNAASCNAVASNAVLVPNILSFTITPLDQPSNSALYVQGPVLGAQTGAAIPAGYQMEGVANANNFALTNGQMIRDVSTFVPGARVTQITRTLTPGNYLVTGDISCDGMPSSSGLVLYLVSDGATFAISRNISPIAGGYVSNSVTRYLRVTNNMVYKIDAEAGGVISGTCATVSTVLRLN